MKKDFPFGWALTFALVVHTLLGIFLKQHPLLIASPLPSGNSAAPVQMRFVEVPPDAKKVQASPNARHLSDANRKAGPLLKSEKRETVTTQPPKNIARSQQQQQNRSGNNSAPQNVGGQPAALPSIEQPALGKGTPSGDYRAPDAKRLSDSLQNLDQFIGSGEGSAEGSGSDSGDVPSGDPGSGVFFDTQGFDLGPWANRVVAIVRSNWIVPVAAELGVKGVVGVSFQVEKSGKIINIRVIKPSGTPSFDQAAVNALKTSNPFPPLPPDFPRPVLPGVFRFYYNVPVPKE